MAGLDFGLLQDKSNIQTADYRSAGSHQAENLKYKGTTTGAWAEIHTVTEGKTFYVSGIAISTGETTIVHIGTGAAASEVTIFGIQILVNVPLVLTLPTPMKFSSGTRISVKAETEQNAHFSLIGWEE